MPKFEYAPAPESRAIVDIETSYGLFIDGEFTDATGHGLQDDQPRRRGGPRRGGRGRAPRTSTRPSPPRAAPTTASGRRMSGADRGKYLFRIARILQERAREFAVLETLDNGKPIKETRDVDVPLGRGALLLPRGLGRQARLRRSLGTTPRAARRRRPDHPVELPAAHARVEDRAGPGHAATPSCSSPPRPRRSRALLFAEVCQQAELPAGVVNIVTGDGAPARRSSTTPTSTRSPSPARPRSAR